MKMADRINTILCVIFLVISILSYGCKEKRYFRTVDQYGNKVVFSECEVNFFSRKKDGICIYYTIDGDTLGISIFKDGKMHGISRTFYSDGIVESVTTFEDGILNGIAQYYYKNGQMAYEVKYNNNSLWNINNLYNNNGEILYKGNFMEGKGIVLKYDSLGNLIEFGNMKNGLRDGFWKTITNTGHIDSLFFRKGRNDELDIEIVLY